jgi:hypothetical protein
VSVRCPTGRTDTPRARNPPWPAAQATAGASRRERRLATGGGWSAQRLLPVCGPEVGPVAVPPPSRMRAREAITRPAVAGGEQLLPRAGRAPFSRSARDAHRRGYASGCSWSSCSDQSGMGEACIVDRRRDKGRRGADAGAGAGAGAGARRASGSTGAGIGAGPCFAGVSSRVESSGRRVSTRDESGRERATAEATAATTASRFLRASYARCRQERRQ